jgi:DNA-binding ferritin-like protein
MNHTELFKRRRNAEIAKNINEAISYFSLEVQVRNFVREKIFKEYMPDKIEMKEMIKKIVQEVDTSKEILSDVLEKTVERAVEKRINDLAEDFKEKIKDKILENIGRDLDDY